MRGKVRLEAEVRLQKLETQDLQLPGMVLMTLC